MQLLKYIITATFLMLIFSARIAFADDPKPADTIAKPADNAPPADKQKTKQQDKASEEKYLLHYKFHEGETLKWDVEHRTIVRATYGGSTQSTETQSTSCKVWKVTEVKPSGEATIEHSVEWAEMRQKLTGAKELHYDSRTDKEAPEGFQSAAKAVGVRLSTIRLDPTGKVISIKRENINPANKTEEEKNRKQEDTWLAVPLPSEAVSVGHVWKIPQNIDVPLEGGLVKKVKALQRFELEQVKNGVAVIHVSTVILTPVSDPAVESQLVQREVDGRVRFDIAEGRLIGQELNIDKNVVGFRGDGSSMHYVNRFRERLQSSVAVESAARTEDTTK
jgi:hypothetical protein